MSTDAPGRAPAGADVRPRRTGAGSALDAAMGWFLVLTVAMGAVLAPRPAALEHVAWDGFSVRDLVFPLFVALGGIGLALAPHAGVAWGTPVRRGAILLAAGLAYNMVEVGRPALDHLRWTGDLQVYAVLVLVVGLLHRVVRGPAAWAAVTAVAATGQALLLHLWQVGCPAGMLTPQCNPSLTIDQAWLGTEHMYAGGVLGHDPAGLVAALGAFVTASAGVVAGQLALRGRDGRRVPAYLLAWAGALALTAVTAGQLVPTIARLWTTPLALTAAALGVTLLAVLRAVLDLPFRGAGAEVRSLLAWPLVALGRNHLLVYFGSGLLMVLLTRGDPGLAYWIGDWAEPYALGHNRAAVIAVVLPLWVGLASVLHWRGVHLRP